MTQRLFITPGEPSGIGPDITLAILQHAFPDELVVIADPDLLRQRAQQLNLPIQLLPCDLTKPAVPHQPGTLTILPVALAVPAAAGQLNINNAHYVMETLRLAATLCQQSTNTALVTGPVHKGIINQAGIPFSGHTEFFAECAGVSHTVMLFVIDQLKVALLTTHIPLAKVSQHITEERLTRTLSILQRELQTRFHLTNPRILICGVNPHAGEGGYLGREEIDVLTPVINKLNANHFQLVGPLPADTIFTPTHLADGDAVLAMYHDQALPLVKYIGFGHAVNMTLGLPFIRTSVDHGTALHIAGTGQADAGSMQAALLLASTLLQSPHQI